MIEALGPRLQPSDATDRPRAEAARIEQLQRRVEELERRVAETRAGDGRNLETEA